MTATYVNALVIGCVCVSFTGALFSLLRGFLAVRAKGRFRHLLSLQALKDVSLRRLSDRVANHDLSSVEAKKALQQIEAVIAQLPRTDRALLEPGLTRNTPKGTARFVKEVLAKEV